MEFTRNQYLMVGLIVLAIGAQLRLVDTYVLNDESVSFIQERSSKKPAILYAIEEVKGRGIPGWLEFDASTLTGRVASLPTRDQINLPVQEQLIVELYSK